MEIKKPRYANNEAREKTQPKKDQIMSTNSCKQNTIGNFSEIANLLNKKIDLKFEILGIDLEIKRLEKEQESDDFLDEYCSSLRQRLLDMELSQCQN